MEKLFDIKYMDLELETKEKFETISHLAKVIEERLVDVNGYVEDVKKRENMSSTGIGDGVAIPHAKSKFVKVPTVAVGRFKDMIDWESLDDEPVKMVFLIAVPEGAGDEHLKILQVLAVSLIDDDFREMLFKEESKEEICKLLLEKVS
ncbi:MAG: PTS sugar transporter subunit IIA [Clostridium sp.]